MYICKLFFTQKTKLMDLKRMLLVNLLIGITGRMQYNILKKVSKNPRRHSYITLRKILFFAKDTVYGKEHNFEHIFKATNEEEFYKRFRENVKPNDYEDLRQYVERHKHGEANVLFHGKPLLYATTSGTTSEPKWIPITRKYLWKIYVKMSRIWLYNFIKHRCTCFGGKVLAIVGKSVEGEAPDGTMYGSVSGVTRDDMPKFIQKLYANPQSVYDISDYNARYYVLMRKSIEQNITIIVTPNPSTIVEMQNNIDKYYDEYIKDIENGTLSEMFDIEPEIRSELEKMLKPNPKRAEKLRKLKEEHGKVLPKHFWPNIQILSTWKCGNTAIYIDQFKNSFPESTFHQELGYFSSECRFGLVLDGSLNTVLFPHYHFYEFVEESELNTPNPHFYLLHELEEGKRYCAYVTTFAGLYRYNMNDLLEVGPKFMETPTVHMVQKINGITSLTGEKLHENQLINAVHQAENETNIKTRFFVGFADLDIKGYRFYYEFEDINISQQQAEDFNTLVDKKLKEINIEYESKRDSLRLKIPVTHRLVSNSFEKYKEECVAEGYRDGQFKIQLLMQDELRHSKFKKLVIE